MEQTFLSGCYSLEKLYVWGGLLKANNIKEASAKQGRKRILFPKPFLHWPLWIRQNEHQMSRWRVFLLSQHYLIQLIPKNLQCLCKDSEGWVPLESVTSPPTSPRWEGELSQTAPLCSLSWTRDPQTCVQHAKGTLPTNSRWNPTNASGTQVLLLASPRRAGHSCLTATAAHGVSFITFISQRQKQTQMLDDHGSAWCGPLLEWSHVSFTN